MTISHTINTDCHVTLTHADINSGDPYGFILAVNDRSYGPGVTIQQTLTGTTTTIKLFFHVLLADDLINPDGSVHAESRSDMYTAIKEYLTKLDGVTLTCPIGSFSNIGASGHVTTEYHFTDLSVIVCQVNNAGTYYGPVDYETLQLSVWDGTLTWATSYWR
jgi:hypothetical protein